MAVRLPAEPYVRGVRIRNYRSIGSCNVRLAPFTLLVGPNGAGKSNFLDALRFVTDALRNPLEHALRDRGGIGEVRRRSKGHPRHFEIWLDINLARGGKAFYGFRVGSLPNGGFRVQEEICRVAGVDAMDAGVEYRVEEGAVSGPAGLPERLEPDRLLLPLAAAVAPFRALYDGLSRLGFYSLNPDRIRDLQDPDPGEMLYRDGGNLAGVVRGLQEHEPKAYERIVEYLRAVVPGVRAVEYRALGPKETIEFLQEVTSDSKPWRFFAASMSDGTLRALGVLVAALQAGNHRGVPLIGIEEPEVAIHPGAAATLTDALLEASHRRQVLVTTHSPDLLDHPGIAPGAILAVEAVAGESHIAPMEPALVQMVKDRLYTVGELLRLEQLRPDEARGVSRDPGVQDDALQ